MKNVTLWTDGACSGNPGPGGYAAILRCGNHEKEVVGGATESTNNRMELKAVSAGLAALKTPCVVTVVTDSQYVIGMLSQGWKRKANHDLLAELDKLMRQHQVRWVKVKAHSGSPMNERVDALAKAEVQRQRSRADFNGTSCVGCGDLARNGFFCGRCKDTLSPEDKARLWAEHCEVRHD